MEWIKGKTKSEKRTFLMIVINDDANDEDDDAAGAG